MQYTIISADSHFNEPPGTFVDRVPATLKDSVPKIVQTADGAENWVFPDEPTPARGFGLTSATLQKGEARGPEKYEPFGLKFDEIARGSWDPKAHVQDMEKDGVQASVLYGGIGLHIYNMKDKDLRLACMRAINDWQAEFESYARDRLIAPSYLPTEEDDTQPAIDELKRCVKEYNIRTAQVPIFPWRRYYDTFYDPLWAAAEEMDIPLAFHRGLQRPFVWGSATGEGPWMANQVMRDFSYTMPFADLIFGGVFDRFPNLKMVSAEGRIGWIPHFVMRADESIRRHRHWLGVDLKLLPSDYVKRNLWSTFIEDRVGILMRDMIGVDRQMWSSDYPHSDSTWPHSLESIEKDFEGVPEADKRKILVDNAVALYKLSAN